MAATSPSVAGSAASALRRSSAITARVPRPRSSALPRPRVSSERARANPREGLRSGGRSNDSMTDSDQFLVVDAEKFDLAATERLFELFAVPREDREEFWQIAFQHAAWNASVVLPVAQVMTGPDGFPYLRLVLPPPGEPFQSNCLSNVCAFCAERGWGAAFFSSAADPPMALQYAIPTGVIE